MTVATNTRKAILPGNGINTNFGFNFAVRSAADLQVYYTDAAGVQVLLAANLYAVALNPVPNGQLWAQGGSVTYPLAGAAIAQGTELTVVRNVPLTQTSVLINQGGYSPQTVEQALDLLAMAMQQVNEAQARALTIPITSTASAALPAPVGNALIGWDPTGSMIINVAAAGAIPLPLGAAQGGTGAANTSAKGTMLVGNAGSYTTFVIGAKGGILAVDLTQANDLVWQAVGTNGLMLAANSAQSSGLQYMPPNRRISGRLTLTTAVPVTIADVTAAATVFWTPYQGDILYIYDGTGVLSYSSVELSIALDNNAGHAGYHQSGKNFDVFAFNDGGTLRIGTGPTWNSGAVGGSDTARGTGAGSTDLQLLNGIQTNKNAITLRWGNAAGNTTAVAVNQASYLGTFRTTADGQTEDSLVKRFLWNNYNRRPRAMRAVDATATWTYTTATWRQANAAAANQLDMVRGLDEDSAYAETKASVQNTSASVEVESGIGLDATNAIAAGVTNNVGLTTASGTTGGNVTLSSNWRGFPGLGRHFLAWLEKSAAAGASTWNGTNSVNSVSGIAGEVSS